MKKTSTVRVSDRASERESASSRYQAEVVALPSPESDEEAFGRRLALERKRSERSNRPFMLMLMYFDDISAGVNGNDDPRGKIFSCLASCIRDTDVLGWHRHGSVIGIIFTDLCVSDNGTVSKRITERIRSKLALCFGPEEMGTIDLYFHVFPEKLGSDELSDHLNLYPEVVVRKTSPDCTLRLSISRVRSALSRLLPRKGYMPGVALCRGRTS
jgi:hypothetical protein